MKILSILILAAALLAGCSGKSAATDNSTKAQAAKTVTVAIRGMSCSGCENTIQEEVSKVAGVSSVKATLADSAAVVVFDPSVTSVEAIGNAITEAGYEFRGEIASAGTGEAK
jgi:copper chaperone CopZ